MRSRFRAVLAAALLCLAALAGAASPAPVAASNGTCSDAQVPSHHGFAGRHSSTIRDGIVATIDVQDTSTGGEFRPCTGWNAFVDGGGPSAWVAFTESSDSNAIVQIGFIACDGIFNQPACDNTLRIFVADGGCGHVPSVVSVIQVPGGYSNGFYDFRIDHLNGKFSLYYRPGGSYILAATILNTDSHVSCWQGSSNVRADFHTERWDHGDGLGQSHLPPGTNTGAVSFIDMKTHSGGVWSLFGTTSSVCDTELSTEVWDGHCQFVGTGAMDAWDG